MNWSFILSKKIYNIIVPQFDSVFSPYTLWGDLNIIRIYGKVDEFVLDFKNVDFINPIAVLELKMLTLKLEDYKLPIVLRRMKPIVESYLRRVNFITNKERSDSDEIIELARLNNPVDVAKLSLKINKILLGWIPDEKYKQYRYEINQIIKEVCFNSIEHSVLGDYSGECWFNLQKYSVGEDRFKIRLAIGDIGIGVKKHIINRFPEWSKLTDTEAIQKALLGNTGRMTGRGGLGLQMVQGVTKKYKGAMLLKSGFGSVAISNQQMMSVHLEHPIPGTVCYLELDSKEW